MALVGAIIASLSLIIIAYSANIFFGIFISGLLIMGFGIGICAFTGKRCYDFSTKGVDIIGDCTGRTFKKLEKVGEPYKFQKRTIQTYKLYTEPFISVDMDFIWAYVRGNNTIDIIIKQDKEDMEENKLNLKPFDIQKAREGKPVCTRDGRKARIVCFDAKRKDGKSIIALVPSKNYLGFEDLIAYRNDGNYHGGHENDGDLMMFPEKKEGWVNVYKSFIYKTQEDAFNRRDKENYLTTIKIEWEE